MMRQIALGAVAAFSMTVIALSVWEPAVAPPPATVPVVQPTREPVGKSSRPANAILTLRPMMIALPMAMLAPADAGP